MNWNTIPTDGANQDNPVFGDLTDTGKDKAKVAFEGNEHADGTAIVNAIMNATKGNPNHFSRDDALWQGTLSGARLVNDSRAALLIGEHVETGSFNSESKFEAKAPSWSLKGVATALLADRLPPLRGVQRMPFVWDGELVTLMRPNGEYHGPSGLWCIIPESIETGWSAADALVVIEDRLGEFPFVGDPDRANAIGMLLGLALKPAYGNGPGAVVGKPASQTGASKWAQSLGWIAQGAEPGFLTASESDDEFNKGLGAVLKESPSVILIDNLSRAFSSDVIAAGMTSDRIRVRRLGSNDIISATTASTTILMTANNPSIAADIANRSVGIRMDAGVENPGERTGFRYELPDDVGDTEGRRLMLSAISSIVCRWLEKGAPNGTCRVLDSFGRHMRAVAGLLELCGIEGYNENIDQHREMTESADEDAFTNFILEWWNQATDQTSVMSTPKTSAQKLLELAGRHMSGRTPLSPEILGKRLKAHVGTIFLADNVPIRLESGRSGKQGRWWKLSKAPKGVSG